jgi:hypothetical protein
MENSILCYDEHANGKLRMTYLVTLILALAYVEIAIIAIEGCQLLSLGGTSAQPGRFGAIE